MDLASELQTLIYHNLDYFTLCSLSQFLPHNRALQQKLAQVCYIDDTTFLEGRYWVSDHPVRDIDASIVIIDIQESEERNVVLSCTERVQEVIIKDLGGVMCWCEIKFPSSLERLTLIHQHLVCLSPRKQITSDRRGSLFKCYDGITLPYIDITHIVIDSCSLMMNDNVEKYFVNALTCADYITISRLGWATCEGDDFYSETGERFYSDVVPYLLEVFPEMTVM